MYKNLRQKSLICLIIIAVVSFLAAGLIWYFSQIPEMPTPVPEMPTPEKSEYPYESVTFNLTGIVEEKGEDWILVEDKTPSPSLFSGDNIFSNFIKIKIVPESKIAKGSKLVSLETIKVGDYVLLKVNQINKTLNEAVASDIFILSSPNGK